MVWMTRNREETEGREGIQRPLRNVVIRLPSAQGGMGGSWFQSINTNDPPEIATPAWRVEFGLGFESSFPEGRSFPSNSCQ